MISLFLTTLRLVRAIWHGLRNDPDFRSLLAIFVLLLAGGVWFYARVEEWSVLDSLYFCVMTMSTIGYGDYVPSGGFSKAFTIIYTLVSVGLFAALVGKIVSHILAVRHERSGTGIARRLVKRRRSGTAEGGSEEASDQHSPLEPDSPQATQEPD